MSHVVLQQLDPALFLSGDEVGQRYACDWSGEHPQQPPVVLRPRDTDDVSHMLALCHQAEQPLAVQGGLTGMAGGATPQAGEWALSLERLNGIHSLDPAGMTMTVGAGTPLQTMQDAAAEAGFRFGVDLGARGSCLAGGLVSTNAGGNQVIQYGMTRAFVLGLVAVLADGTVIPARNTLLKNNAGFDLKQLFIGTEGTLGIVTEVTFRLFPAKPYRQTALCALASFDAVVELLQRAARRLESLSSFEVMWSSYFQAALAATQVSDPFAEQHAFYVLLESDGVGESALTIATEAMLGGLLEEGLLDDAAIAQSHAEADRLWQIRDGIGELLKTMAPAANFDIGIPIDRMDQFTAEIDRELMQAFNDCQVLIFGHVGDGNLHLAVTTGRVEDVYPIYDHVYRKTGDFSGTVTAEHGIGAMKKPWLSDCRSEAEIALMRSLKQTLDPQRILNRGRVI